MVLLVDDKGRAKISFQAEGILKEHFTGQHGAFSL